MTGRDHAVLDVRGLSKVYGEGDTLVQALRGVNLLVERGDYVAIMGSSGSGKSTLMNILGCLDIPTSGRYLLDGVDVSRLNDRQLALVRNRRIGFVFQAFNLIPRTSALANVELPLAYAGLKSAERRRRALAALAAVGLDERANHEPNQLSGGQQQRVAVARALVTAPALVLADEPTGNLDSRSTADILTVLDRLNQAGRTIVLITHEPDVAAHARRLIRLVDGEIVTDERQRPLDIGYGSRQATGDLPPNHLAPDHLAPGALAPGELAPGALAPGALAPGALVPAEFAPAELAAKPAAGGPAPGGPAPGGPAPAQTPRTAVAW